MSSEEVSVILAEAVARPTLGPRSLLRHLRDRGVHRSASGVAKVLRRHHLGTARQRVAALASLTAVDSGQVTDAALEGPFGFCLYASTPGQVVSLDTFYVGRLKGVGAVWQLTAVDVATRIAVCQLVVGDKTATVAASFLDHLRKALRKHGITLTGVLSDIQSWWRGIRADLSAGGEDRCRPVPARQRYLTEWSAARLLAC